MSLGTVHGWAPVLAAMRTFATTDDVPARLLDQVSGTLPVAVAMVDLKSRSVVAVSPMFSDLVGRPAPSATHFPIFSPNCTCIPRRSCCASCAPRPCPAPPPAPERDKKGWIV